MRIQASENPLRSEPRRLSVVFFVSTLGYGGAETLLENLVCRLDPRRFAVAVCCTKTFGPIGERLRQKLPVFEYRLQRKWDVRILRWMKQRLRHREADIVITVGAGDKMFWGRLAAWWAGVPVIISALHTTGWPDEIGKLNRLLTPLNDAFVAVAKSHQRYLTQTESLPRDKVHVIDNGIDTDRFRPREARRDLRDALGIPDGAQLVGIVARLGVEKNHELFLRVAKRVRNQLPNTHFLVVGDGPRRGPLEQLADELKINDCTHFTGTRSDVEDLLALMDLFLLTSHSEASPVSVLEAMSSGTPVIATRVGSVPETIVDGQMGYLVSPGDEQTMSRRVVQLLTDSNLRLAQGRAGRKRVVDCSSIDAMVGGYEQLMLGLWSQKVGDPLCRHDQSAREVPDNADRMKLGTPLERA